MNDDFVPAATAEDGASLRLISVAERTNTVVPVTILVAFIVSPVLRSLVLPTLINVPEEPVVILVAIAGRVLIIAG